MSDPFLDRVARAFQGEGKDAEELIEQVARRLLKINMVNPAVTQRVVNEVYGDVIPLPPNFSQRLLAKCQELRNKKVPA